MVAGPGFDAGASTQTPGGYNLRVSARKDREDLSRRFWAKVDKTRKCWNWTGSCTPDGYGKFRVGHACVRASRFAYEELVDVLEPDMLLRHTCRNSLCVNPAHLEPVTARELAAIANSPPGANARKTH